MKWATASGSYRYRRDASKAWTVTNYSCRVRQQSEALLMQELRRLRPGCDVELVSIRWRD